jgi:hypothetical protein
MSFASQVPWPNKGKAEDLLAKRFSFKQIAEEADI